MGAYSEEPPVKKIDAVENDTPPRARSAWVNIIAKRFRDGRRKERGEPETT